MLITSRENIIFSQFSVSGLQSTTFSLYERLFEWQESDSASLIGRAEVEAEVEAENQTLQLKADCSGNCQGSKWTELDINTGSVFESAPGYFNKHRCSTLIWPSLQVLGASIYWENREQRNTQWTDDKLIITQFSAHFVQQKCSGRRQKSWAEKTRLQ